MSTTAKRMSPRMPERLTPKVLRRTALWGRRWIGTASHGRVMGWQPRREGHVARPQPQRLDGPSCLRTGILPRQLASRRAAGLADRREVEAGRGGHDSHANGQWAMGNGRW